MFFIYLRYVAGEDVNDALFLRHALKLIGQVYDLKFIKTHKVVSALEFRVIDKARFLKETKPLDPTAGHRSSSVNAIEMVYSNFDLESIGGSIEDVLNIPVIVTKATYARGPRD